MRKLTISIFFIIYFPFSFSAVAMWAKMTDQELIGNSSLIVSAKLIGITEITPSKNGHPLRLGVLQITRTFKGDKDLSVVFIKLPKPSNPISSTDIFYSKGDKGIWFLRRDRHGMSGIYYADNPQRLWTEDRTERLILLLSK